MIDALRDGACKAVSGRMAAAPIPAVVPQGRPPQSKRSTLPGRAFARSVKVR
jgi:hypothetical protein